MTPKPSLMDAKIPSFLGLPQLALIFRWHMLLIMCKELMHHFEPSENYLLLLSMETVMTASLQGLSLFIR
jgi:hypothetical protein